MLCCVCEAEDWSFHFRNQENIYPFGQLEQQPHGAEKQATLTTGRASAHVNIDSNEIQTERILWAGVQFCTQNP